MFKRLIIVFLIIFFSGYAFADKPDGMTHLNSLWIGNQADDPTTTPGNNDLYVGGTIEAGGAVTYPETVGVVLRDVCAADGNVLGIANTNGSGDHYLNYSSGAFKLFGNYHTAAATNTDVSLVQFPMPNNYKDGEDITIRCYANYADGSGIVDTIDVSAYRYVPSAGAVSGGDLVSTAAQTVTDTNAAYDFTVTPTTILSSDQLNFAITTVVQSADGSGYIGINDIQVIMDAD